MLTETEAPEEIEDLAEELGAPCWRDLLEKDDRTSPEEYPDHCLISRDELIEYIKVALDMAMDPKAPVIHQNAVAAERERAARIAEGGWINSTSPWAERNGAAKVDAHNAACAQIALSIRHVNK